MSINYLVQTKKADKVCKGVDYKATKLCWHECCKTSKELLYKSCRITLWTRYQVYPLLTLLNKDLGTCRNPSKPRKLILLNIVAAFWKSNRLLSLHTSQLANNAGAFHSFSRVLGSRVLGIKMLPYIVKWLSSCFCLQTKSYMKLTSISFSVKISEKMLGFNNNYYNYHYYYTYREINTLTRFSRLTFFWGILLSLCTAV